MIFPFPAFPPLEQPAGKCILPACIQTGAGLDAGGRRGWLPRKGISAGNAMRHICGMMPGRLRDGGRRLYQAWRQGWKSRKALGAFRHSMVQALFFLRACRSSFQSLFAGRIYASSGLRSRHFCPAPSLSTARTGVRLEFLTLSMAACLDTPAMLI